MLERIQKTINYNNKEIIRDFVIDEESVKNEFVIATNLNKDSSNIGHNIIPTEKDQLNYNT